jgi:hypothetical protein
MCLSQDLGLKCLGTLVEWLYGNERFKGLGANHEVKIHGMKMVLIFCSLLNHFLST